MVSVSNIKESTLELFFNKNFYDKRNINYPTLHEFSGLTDNRISVEYNFYDKKLIPLIHRRIVRKLFLFNLPKVVKSADFVSLLKPSDLSLQFKAEQGGLGAIGFT